MEEVMVEVEVEEEEVVTTDSKEQVCSVSHNDRHE